MDKRQLKLKFHGVRGSLPTPLASHLSYGGNTTCVEVLGGGGERRLFLDCGSGLRTAQRERHGGPLQFDILMTHYHSDHLLGLPFFEPLYDRHAAFRFYGCVSEAISVREALERSVRPPWHPVSIDSTPSHKEYHDLDGSTLDLGPLTVSYAAQSHPQGVLAYRLDLAGRSVVFATDIERGDPRMDDSLATLARGADVLIHDAQYTPPEYERFRGWGHSSWRDAIEAAQDAGVPRLVLFHHDPDRTDDELDSMVAEAGKTFAAVEAAREGSILVV